ncbi:MAG: YCF48-related protein [Bacteroidota bacterium]
MKTPLLFIVALMTHFLSAQTSWLPTNSVSTDRYDDVFFISPDTGWAVGSIVGLGKIYHTVNGGSTWSIQKSLNTYARSIEFSDKNNGFAGALSSGGQNVFFKTTDGGSTWTDISSVITGTNRGICGICCVNTSITYAVGVWSSPAYVMKTIDGGVTWSQINMGPYASRLVDVQFTDANNGYVTGQSNVTGEGAVILKTTDGGATWTKVYTSNSAGEYVWKIQNLDGQNWFASIEAAVTYSTMTNNVFIKSTDGGNTWITKAAPYSNYFQGIGFIDANRGWIGNSELFETNDGGDSWTPVATGQSYNAFDRFQKVNSTLAYFSSNIIHRLGNVTSTGIKEMPAKEKPKWLSVYPNPAKDEISYRLDLPNKTMFSTRIFNAKSEIIWELTDQKEKGSYSLKVDKKLSPGIYFVYVMFNEHAECDKVIIE